MRTARRIGALPSGRRSKYVVLVFWLLAFFVAGPLAGKLQGVQKNEFAEWLPGSAESTAVLHQTAEFQSKDLVAAVVVYERSSGLTDADKAKVAGDVRELSSVDGAAKVVGPVPWR